MRALLCSILIFLAAPAAAEDMPAWFKESFLVMPEDVAEAAKSGRRLMLYFHQDGCPYCAKLLRENFSDRAIAEKTRKHFDVIAINLWGDREVTDFAGKATSEKAFAKALRVQFTPTLIMFDEKGGTALRLNGYIPPHQFHAALDYAGGRLEKKQSYTDYLQAHAKEAASGKLHAQPWLPPSPVDLSQRDARPTLVLFEQKVCAGCDEMHAEGFPRPEVAELLKRFRAARVDIGSNEALKTPQGKSLAMRDWARQLKIAYTPSFVFFDAGGREVFRVEGYLRPFHLSSSLDYVASGAYKTQPEFQRFIEARAAARRAKGEKIELMK
ncbi:MAG: thioredoxin fold domain-containing protein [Rhodocyclaceae bacterium]|jgi:thioredoxin-related protein|nr:Thiol:disulfide interchange protein DsbD [Rhodocyclaceae bacterium]MBZ0143551.1 thioredoxin fold domain-containing protein [Rhodocyclaceae bacterium]MCC6880272.1 thioredoxin fold domain-containing protein [Rhodocyclaceae bacterium]